VARHSWATIAKNSGTPTQFIMERLGHSNVAVTQSYLDQFGDDELIEHGLKMDSTIRNAKVG
jgi:integrase